ncbi:MAG: hypothetical protein GY772_23840 [bacterium]|nr:hypothetical protein [bacterium]
MRRVFEDPICGILAALLGIRELQACHALLLLKVDELAKGRFLLGTKTADDGDGLALVARAELLIERAEAVAVLRIRQRHGALDAQEN